jgi:hypothetical protein
LYDINAREAEGGHMTKTVADQFAAVLVAAGVKRIYGIVGDSLNGLTDVIRRLVSNNLARFAGLHWRRQRMRVN